jgi:hypothetical protein
MENVPCWLLLLVVLVLVTVLDGDWEFGDGTRRRPPLSNVM